MKGSDQLMAYLMTHMKICKFNYPKIITILNEREKSIFHMAIGSCIGFLLIELFGPYPSRKLLQLFRYLLSVEQIRQEIKMEERPLIMDKIIQYKLCPLVVDLRTEYVDSPVFYKAMIMYILREDDHKCLDDLYTSHKHHRITFTNAELEYFVKGSISAQLILYRYPYLLKLYGLKLLYRIFDVNMELFLIYAKMIPRRWYYTKAGKVPSAMMAILKNMKPGLAFDHLLQMYNHPKLIARIIMHGTNILDNNVIEIMKKYKIQFTHVVSYINAQVDDCKCSACWENNDLMLYTECRHCICNNCIWLITPYKCPMCRGDIKINKLNYLYNVL